MIDPVDTDALREDARLRFVSADLLEMHGGVGGRTRETAERLVAAADEVDRLRDVIDTLSTTYDVDKILRAIKAGE